MKNIMKLFVGISWIVLTVLGTLDMFKAFKAMRDISSAGIIGGADEPTADLIFSKLGIPAVTEIAVGVLLIVISVILSVMSRRRKGKHKCQRSEF